MSKTIRALNQTNINKKIGWRMTDTHRHLKWTSLRFTLLVQPKYILENNIVNIVMDQKNIPYDLDIMKSIRTWNNKFFIKRNNNYFF